MAASDPLPGWTSASGLLEPSDLVAGHAARGQAVKGSCRSDARRRTVTLEPADLCRLGLGGLPMRKVEQLWRCNRLEGCGLQFHKEPALYPLRIGKLAGRPNVRVRLRCRGNGCKFFRVWRVEEMIAGLIRRKAGDEETDVDTLGAKMTSPCPLCRKANWAAEIVCINMESAGWRTQGERMFD